MKIIDLARTYIGTTERTGKNDVLFNDWYYGRKVSGAAYAWCVVFIAYLFDKLGYKFCDVKTASTNYVMNYAKKVGKWVTKDFKPGDLIIYDWDGDGRANHIGIFVRYSGSKVVTIEGNTSGPKYDGVYEKTRSMSKVLGAYRPEYPAEKNDGASAWAVEATEWAKAKGLFEGTPGGYEWQRPITREEMAVVLYRLNK